MKLATYRISGETTWGIIKEEDAVNVGALLHTTSTWT